MGGSFPLVRYGGEVVLDEFPDAVSLALAKEEVVEHRLFIDGISWVDVAWRFLMEIWGYDGVPGGSGSRSSILDSMYQKKREYKPLSSKVMEPKSRIQSFWGGYWGTATKSVARKSRSFFL